MMVGEDYHMSPLTVPVRTFTQINKSSSESHLRAWRIEIEKYKMSPGQGSGQP